MCSLPRPLGFVPLAPAVPVLQQILTTAAAMFAANEMLNKPTQPNQQPAETPNFQTGEGITYDFPPDSITNIRYNQNSSEPDFDVSFRGPLTFKAGIGPDLLPQTLITGTRTDTGYAEDLPFYNFRLRGMENVEGNLPFQPVPVDTIQQETSQGEPQLTLSTGISAEVEPTLKNIKQGVDTLIDVFTKPGKPADGNNPATPPRITNITEITEEITINVNADIDRVITELYNVQTNLFNYLSSQFGVILPQIFNLESVANMNHAELVALIQNIPEVEIPEIEIPEIDLDGIRTQLEVIISKTNDVDSDLQLAAGVIANILDAVVQVLEEAGEIKEKQRNCEAQDEEENEDCCDLIEEIHEIVTSGQTGSFSWSESCEDEQAGLREFGGVGFGGVLTGISELGSRLEIINRKICDVDPVAAVPEGWNLRPESQRGQLVVLLDIGKDGKFSKANRQITIPHYSGGQVVPDIAYTSGNSYGMLVLADNSKVRVYASSQGAAEGVCNQIMGMISGQYTIGAYVVTGEVKRNIQSHLLRARVAKFYAPGHSPGASPIWVARRPSN